MKDFFLSSIAASTIAKSYRCGDFKRSLRAITLRFGRAEEG